MSQSEWKTIPVLPCISIGETLTFWESLGFTITYRQDRPYPYGVVERGGFALHFVRIKGVDPASSAHCCLIMVDSAGKVHSDFSKALKSLLGRVPTTGLPRVSRMKPGQTRFTLTDPAGNSVIFIQYGEQDAENYEKADQENLSPLQKSIALAVRLRDFKEDHEGAAKVLDLGLKKLANENEIDIAETLVMRAELARVLNHPDMELICNAKLEELAIEADELQALKVKHCWLEA